MSCSSALAWAEDSETLAARAGPSFLLVSDASGGWGCGPSAIRRPILLASHERLVAQSGIDPQFAVLWSLDVPPCSDIFYVPVKNDIRGIGYQHTEPEELFDDSPETRLEGLVFLNDAPYWETREQELSESFLHEVGHRWGARVHIDADSPTLLLGRDQKHWSALLDSHRSPLEGNSWQRNERLGRTTSHGQRPRFSPLDRYLMGLLPADDVGPLWILTPDESGLPAEDCSGAPWNAESPPQDCGPVEVPGTWSEWSVDDVIAIEGERSPAFSADSEQREWTIGVYFLAPTGTTWTVSQCRAWSTRIEQLLDDFETATDGRGSLSLLTGGGNCEELVNWLDERDDSPSLRAGGGACSWSPRPRLPASSLAVGCFLGALVWCGARRRKPYRCEKASSR